MSNKRTIYCKNKKCKYYKFLDEPVLFKFSQIYTPFEDDKCCGECSKDSQLFTCFDICDGAFRYEGAECWEHVEYHNNRVGCTRIDCLYNEFINEKDGASLGYTKCSRNEILVDRLQDKWVCKCFSFRKVRGHIDWFSLLKPDGTAKGGHVDDAYAQKINKYAKTTRSYRTHMKQNT